MDFIATASGVPINSPIVHELFVTGAPADALPNLPHSNSHSNAHSRSEEGVEIGGQQMTRVFASGGGRAAPGQEWFVLKDGQTCALRRQGARDVVFQVPVRCEKAAAEDLRDVDVLPFPHVLWE